MDLITAIMWLTLNIYHESRGEEQLGQIAVAHVTLNRVKKRNTSVKEVVISPYQFSWVHTKKWEPKDIPALVQCFHSAVIAMNGFDFTSGATHYHRKDIKPWWAKKKKMVAMIGNHMFYNDIKMIRALKKKRRVLKK